MLRRYRDIEAFVDVLNTADRRCTKRGDMEFISELRMRWFQDTEDMRLLWREHVRLIALWWRARLLELIEEDQRHNSAARRIAEETA